MCPQDSTRLSPALPPPTRSAQPARPRPPARVVRLPFAAFAGVSLNAPERTHLKRLAACVLHQSGVPKNTLTRAGGVWFHLLSLLLLHMYECLPACACARVSHGYVRPDAVFCAWYTQVCHSSAVRAVAPATRRVRLARTRPLLPLSKLHALLVLQVSLRSHQCTHGA